MVQISCASPELWQRAAANDKHCTFFQTIHWHRIACKYLNAESIPLLFSWGNQEAVLPLLRLKKFMFAYYFSPFGTYTNLVSPAPLEAPQLDDVSRFLRRKNIELCSSPFGASIRGLPVSRKNATHIIGLDALDPSNISKKWKKGHRDNLRMGLRQGVTVRTGEGSQDLADYYSLYVKTLKRWLSPTVSYRFSLFEDIYNSLLKTGKAKLWCAQWQGNLIYAVIVFYYNTHAVAWHSVSDSDHFRQYPSQVIYDTIIRDAKDRGIRIFDLNPSGSLEGVIAWKNGFGAEQVPFDSFRNLTPAFRIAAGIKKVLGLR